MVEAKQQKFLSRGYKENKILQPAFEIQFLLKIKLQGGKKKRIFS